MFLGVVLVIFALQAFAQIDILTGGGPGGSTETLVFKIADPRGTEVSVTGRRSRSVCSC